MKPPLPSLTRDPGREPVPLPEEHPLGDTHVGRRRSDLDDGSCKELHAAIADRAGALVLPAELLERNGRDDPAFGVEIAPFFVAASELPFRRLQLYALRQLDLAAALIPAGWLLADSHPDNVAWVGGGPKQADWGSFVPHKAGEPWPALKQFMETFACPLLVSATNGVPANALLAGFPDGMPTHYARRLIPLGFKLTHPFLAALLAAGSREKALAGARQAPEGGNDAGLLWTLRRLSKLVGGLSPPAHRSYWGGYDPPYSKAGLAARDEELARLMAGCGDGLAVEVGANHGQHTRHLADGRCVVAIEPDPDCADSLARKFPDGDVHVVVADIMDDRPTRRQPPLIERVGRRRPAVAVAMAVLHHMSVSHGLDAAVAALARIGAKTTVVEWIPPEDGSVAEMRARSLLPSYDRKEFDLAVAKHFGGAAERRVPVPDSGRELILLRRG